MKTGLVLEGGGQRGIYTAGVLDVFMEEGLHFDGVIGVSAGSVHGCSFGSNQHERSIRYNKKYCKDPRFMGFRSFLTTGDIVGVDFCYHELPDKLEIFDHDAYESSGTEFYVTCSNVETGKAEYIRIKNMRTEIDYLRASASLPYFSRIVEFGGKKMLDGGCTDSVPVEAFQNMGFTKNVVVLTRQAAYRKKPENRAFAKLCYRKYPKFADALINRHTEYNKTMEKIEAMEKEGSIFVIRPSEIPAIGRMEKDPEKIQAVYDLGRRDAEKVIDKLKIWLG